MSFGVLAQILAVHLRLPGIVLLLAVGVLMGPDYANVIRPETLGEGLPAFVGFAVAIILFEGGLQNEPQATRTAGQADSAPRHDRCGDHGCVGLSGG